MLDGIGDFGKSVLGLGLMAGIGASIGYLIKPDKTGVLMGAVAQTGLYSAQKLLNEKADSRALFVASGILAAGFVGFLFVKQNPSRVLRQPALLGLSRGLPTPKREETVHTVMGIS